MGSALEVYTISSWGWCGALGRPGVCRGATVWVARWAAARALPRGNAEAGAGRKAGAGAVSWCGALGAEAGGGAARWAEAGAGAAGWAEVSFFARGDDAVQTCRVKMRLDPRFYIQGPYRPRVRRARRGRWVATVVVSVGSGIVAAMVAHLLMAP